MRVYARRGIVKYMRALITRLVVVVDVSVVPIEETALDEISYVNKILT